MRKVRDVLRLSAAGLSKRKIAASLGMSATAARDCIWRARRAGLAWPLPADLTDEELECRLYRGQPYGGIEEVRRDDEGATNLLPVFLPETGSFSRKTGRRLKTNGDPREGTVA
jgi:hypothetical protein